MPSCVSISNIAKLANWDVSSCVAAMMMYYQCAQGYKDGLILRTSCNHDLLARYGKIEGTELKKKKGRKRAALLHIWKIFLGIVGIYGKDLMSKTIFVLCRVFLRCSTSGIGIKCKM